MRSMKLGFRLTGLFLIMAFIVLIIGMFGIWSLSRVKSSITDVIKSRGAQEKQATLMKSSLVECRVHLFEAALVQTDIEEFNLAKDDFDIKRSRFESYLNILSKGNAKLGVPPAGEGSVLAQYLEAIKKPWEDYVNAANGLFSYKEALLKGLTPGKLDVNALNALADQKLNTLVKNTMWEMTDKVSVSVDELLVTVMKLQMQAAKESEMVARKADITLIVVMACGILLAFVLGTVATRNIVTRVKLIAAAIGKGADGDLTASVPEMAKDELGTLGMDFNLMVNRLAEMLGAIKSSIMELSQINQNMAQISSRSTSSAELQALGVNQTSTTIIEMSASIDGVAFSMENLSLSASESSAATLKLVTNIEEVAANVDKLAAYFEEISSSIIQMASSIRDIDYSVANVVEATSTTASSIITLDGSISQIRQSTNETAEITSEVRKDAELGKESVDATISGIAEIKRSSALTSEVMDELYEKASQIGNILSVIDEVAEQTNLLALNAAIIAAQAGEHGKGFAVVASEIKSLAGRTRHSTKEISDVINGVQDLTQRAVESLGLASKRIVEGEALSKQSGGALQKIVDGVNRAATNINRVASASEEQSKESQQIREAMVQVSEMINQIARATNEQGRGSNVIMAAVERMKELNYQVSLSTKEQTLNGIEIGKNAERIASMAKEVRLATVEQSKGSSQIIKAVEDIQQTTEVNIEATRVLNESVSRLNEQSERLSAAMKLFKITESPDDPDYDNGGSRLDLNDPEVITDMNLEPTILMAPGAAGG